MFYRPRAIRGRGAAAGIGSARVAERLEIAPGDSSLLVYDEDPMVDRQDFADRVMVAARRVQGTG